MIRFLIYDNPNNFKLNSDNMSFSINLNDFTAAAINEFISYIKQNNSCAWIDYFYSPADYEAFNCLENLIEAMDDYYYYHGMMDESNRIKEVLQQVYTKFGEILLAAPKKILSIDLTVSDKKYVHHRNLIEYIIGIDIEDSDLINGILNNIDYDIVGIAENLGDACKDELDKLCQYK